MVRARNALFASAIAFVILVTLATAACQPG